MAGVRFPPGASEFSPFHNIEMGSGAQTASNEMDIGDLYPKIK
jgi:hypothetical protein